MLLVQCGLCFLHLSTESRSGTSKWDVSRVTYKSQIFAEVSSFNGAISKWDVPSVMSGMFNACFAASLNGVSKWDVSSVEDMSQIRDMNSVSYFRVRASHVEIFYNIISCVCAFSCFARAPDCVVDSVVGRWIYVFGNGLQLVSAFGDARKLSVESCCVRLVQVGH